MAQMSRTIGGSVVWRGDECLAAYKKRIAGNLDRAAMLVVRDVVTHFGSPPPMPKGQLTKYGVKVMAKRAKLKAEKAAAKAAKAPRAKGKK